LNGTQVRHKGTERSERNYLIFLRFMSGGTGPKNLISLEENLMIRLVY